MNRRELLKFPLGLTLASILPTFKNCEEAVTLASPLEVERFGSVVSKKPVDDLYWEVKLRRTNYPQPIVCLHMHPEVALAWEAEPEGEIVFGNGTKALRGFAIFPDIRDLR